MTVLSGFLGAGKTTLLRHLLAQAEGRCWAAVVNDLAALNIDAQVVAAAGASRTVALGNGCVCCSVRDELAETIAELAATGDFEHILVETTGVAEPRGVADLFVRRNAFGRNLGDFARLSALVTVVDARAWLDEHRRSRELETPAPAGKKPLFELMVEQAECADVLVLNKSDLTDPAEWSELERALAALNPRAARIGAERGQVPAEFLLDRPRFDATATLGGARWIRVLQRAAGRTGGDERRYLERPAEEAAHEARYGIASLVFEARTPLVEARFATWLERGRPPGLLRAKGFYWCAEAPAEMGFLSIAGGRVRRELVGTWAAALRERGVVGDAEIPAAARARWAEPFGDRRQELVFIGTGLDAGRIDAELRACLAVEAEIRK